MNLRCLVLGIFLALHFTTNNGIFLKFTNLVCDNFNKSWVTFHECRLRAVNRNKTVININATFHYPAYEIDIDAQIFKKANGYKPWLFKVSIDACRFIRKPYNLVAIIVFKMFREFTNINHTCPYVGPQIVKGLYPRPEMIGVPLPTGEYLLKMLWSMHKQAIFTTNVYFTYTED